MTGSKFQIFHRLITVKKGGEEKKKTPASGVGGGEQRGPNSKKRKQYGWKKINLGVGRTREYKESDTKARCINQSRKNRTK